MAGPRAGRLDRVRPRHAEPVIATMAEQLAFVEGAGDLGGTMRLGLYPADLAEGTVVAGGVRRATGRGAAPAPLRGQQRLPRAARGGRAGVLRHLAGRQPRRVRRAAGRRAPVLRRHPGPPRAALAADARRTRSSPGWSRRRCSASASCSSRSTRAPCGAAGSPTRRRPRARSWLSWSPTWSPTSRTQTPRGGVRGPAPGLSVTDPVEPADRPGSWPVVGTRRHYDGGLGGGPARGRRAPARPPRGDLRPPGPRAPRRGRRAGRRRRRAGLLPAAVPPRQPGGDGRAARPASATRSGEDPVDTAARELREEAELRAEHWRLLADSWPSAGITAERHLVYLARGLSHADRGDFELHAEEAEIEVFWTPFDDLLEAVLDGRVQEGPLMIAVLTYDALRRRDRL